MMMSWLGGVVWAAAASSMLATGHPGVVPWEPSPDHPRVAPSEPPLFSAARTGDHAAIRELVAQGHSPNDVADQALDEGSDWFVTPLMTAAGSGDGASVETVRLLLELGAKPEMVIECGSAADFALNGLGWNYRPGGDAERLQVLLEAGSPLNMRDGRQVAEAAGTGDVQRLRIVLDRGGKPNVEWDAAADKARWEAMLAEMPPETARLMGEHESTGPSDFEIPLFRAAESGCVASVKLLLERGADPKVLADGGGTALFVAANAPVAEALLEAGVDPSLVDSFGDDAITDQLALLSGRPAEVIAARTEVVKLLAAHGLSLSRAVGSEYSRLHDCAFAHEADGVELLLRLDGSLKGETSTLGEALHAICWQGEAEDPEVNEACRRIVEMLIDAGAPVDFRDPDRWTPLHQAAGGDWGNVTATRVLLARGARVDAVTPDGMTALMIAASNGEVEVVEALLAAGADPRRRCRDRETAIDYARAHLQTMRELAENPVDLREMGIEIDPEESAQHAKESLDEAVRTLRALTEAAKKREG